MRHENISRIRAQKAREREKHAAKTSGGKLSFKDHPAVGLFIAIATWSISVLFLDANWSSFSFSKAESFLPLAGKGIFILISLFAAGLFLEIVKPGMIHNNYTILLLSIISMLSIVLARVVLSLARDTSLIPLPVADFFLPMALAPLLATVLVDGAAGVAVGIWTSLMMAIMANDSFPVLITGMIATVVAAHTAGNIRTRGRIFKTGLIIGLSQITCISALTALNWQNSDVVLVAKQSVACLAGGFFSAAIVLVIIPIFEMLFGVTTDISLLELSDPSHPLLQRLAMEAPGTYHHSLLVANLAHAAAEEIGANALLVRVCAYFHDAGKLIKPEFFAENMQLQNNPHDDLPPSMSSLVIISHVKEGVSLGEIHKLPPAVVNAIEEHHGTSLVSYFHYKASRESENDQSQAGSSNGQSTVDESSFRYPGPKPSSRESAILCLADAVEAASRTMDRRSPAQVEGLVNEIINTRLEDGQLDECDLTVEELAEVRRSFAFTLMNMFHGRVPYPKNED